MELLDKQPLTSLIQTRKQCSVINEHFELLLGLLLLGLVVVALVITSKLPKKNLSNNPPSDEPDDSCSEIRVSGWWQQQPRTTSSLTWTGSHFFFLLCKHFLTTSLTLTCLYLSVYNLRVTPSHYDGSIRSNSGFSFLSLQIKVSGFKLLSWPNQ